MWHLELPEMKADVVVVVLLTFPIQVAAISIAISNRRDYDFAISPSKS